MTEHREATLIARDEGAGAPLPNETRVTTGDRANPVGEEKRAFFDEVWREHQPYVLAICQSILPNPADAEDALSEIALRAWLRLPARDGLRNPRGWLARLARNRCIDLRRQALRAGPSESLEALTEDGLSLPSAAVVPEQSLLEADHLRRITRRLHALPPALREPAVLHFEQELGYPALAAELGITQENARKRIQKVRLLLRRGADRPRARARVG